MSINSTQPCPPASWPVRGASTTTTTTNVVAARGDARVVVEAGQDLPEVADNALPGLILRELRLAPEGATIRQIRFRIWDTSDRQVYVDSRKVEKVLRHWRTLGVARRSRRRLSSGNLVHPWTLVGA